jgi:hypothetical protein
VPQDVQQAIERADCETFGELEERFDPSPSLAAEFRVSFTREPGPFQVTITGRRGGSEFARWLFVAANYEDWCDLADRITDVGPVTVFDGLSQKSAIEAKKHLESSGARIRIKEARVVTAGAAVQREWYLSVKRGRS